MKLFLPILCVGLALLQPLRARADDASHRAAAEALMTQLNMELLTDQAIDKVLEAQMQQSPALSQFREPMKAFFSKYMSWASLKNDLVKVYTEEFTEPELKEMSAFYRTPVGQKMIQRMPVLMGKGMEIGQKRVQEHLPELQATIQAQAGAAAPAKATSPAKKTP